MYRDNCRKKESLAHLVTNLSISDIDIQSLGKLDSIGITDPSEVISREEEMKSVQEHFLQTIRVNQEGRYEVT